MSHVGFTESDVEDAALEWFEGLGYVALRGPDIAPDGDASERAGYDAVVLEARLRDAVARLNPAIPAEAQDEAFRRVTRPASATLLAS